MLDVVLEYRGVAAEILVVVALLTLAFLLPSTSRWCRAIECWAGRVARRRALSIALVGFIAAAVSAAPSALRGVPEPNAHDEFSYLLAADTFARGRLSNSPHPLWEHFESFHIIHQPTYASKYPPAQGLILAFGQVVGKHAITGVWISIGLAVAALYWMLLAWVPARWALLAAGLTLVHPGIALTWGGSYWGGAMAMLGGALLFGALRRIVERPRRRDGLWLGLGLAILANSRPYEGLVASLPAAAVLLGWLLRGRSVRPRVAFEHVVVPVVMVLALTGAMMAFYNWRVTGHALRLPYMVHEQTYTVKPFFAWMPRRPMPVYRHRELETFHVGAPGAAARNRTGFWFRDDPERALLLWTFYTGGRGVSPALALPLVMLLGVIRDRWSCFALASCGAVAAGLLAGTWLFPHYAAPIVGLFVALLVQGMRRLHVCRWRGRRVGMWLVWTVAIVALLSFARTTAWQLRDKGGWGTRRAEIARQLEAAGGRHLVIVRYGPSHNLHREWVYNGADIDSAPVVWARDMAPSRNERLLQYFGDRRVWLLEENGPGDPVTLVPY